MNDCNIILIRAFMMCCCKPKSQGMTCQQKIEELNQEILSLNQRYVHPETLSPCVSSLTDKLTVFEQRRKIMLDQFRKLADIKEASSINEQLIRIYSRQQWEDIDQQIFDFYGTALASLCLAREETQKMLDQLRKDQRNHQNLKDREPQETLECLRDNLLPNNLQSNVCQKVYLQHNEEEAAIIDGTQMTVGQTQEANVIETVMDMKVASDDEKEYLAETVEVKNTHLLEQAQQQIIKHEKMISSLRRQLQQEFTHRNEHEQLIRSLKGQIATIQRELISECRKREDEIAKMSRQNDALLKECRDLRQSLLQLEKVRSERQVIRTDNARMREEYLRLERQREEEQQLFEREKQEKQESLSSLNLMRLARSSFMMGKVLFQSWILLDNDKEKHRMKMFMVREIEQLMKQTIAQTRLIYELEQDSRINFHERIDNKPGLVFLLQTQKAIIGGFYAGSLQPQRSLDQEGILFNLLDCKAYRLNIQRYNPEVKKDKHYNAKTVKAMTYDKFFLVFGNSEIRLKQSERVVFSNFGIVNSYFFTRKENVDSFLHEGDNREANLTGLEIHQVMFNEGQP